MVNIPYVRAITYHKTMSSGRNTPSLFTCIDNTGEYYEYVVKLRSELGTYVIFELMGALIGYVLGIPIPPVAIVEIDSRMGLGIPDSKLSQLIVSDPGPHFGSQFVKGGYSIYSPNTYLSDAVNDQKINIFAFDMLIQNYDRTHDQIGKPNLLYRGDELVVIDHELAFAFAVPPQTTTLPWNIRELNIAKRHIFFHDLQTLAAKSELSFAPFIENLNNISVEDFEQLTEVVPIEWYNERCIENILIHLANIRNNIGLFEKGLLEVFA
jgi:hypothetical protein